MCPEKYLLNKNVNLVQQVSKKYLITVQQQDMSKQYWITVQQQEN